MIDRVSKSSDSTPYQKDPAAASSSSTHRPFTRSLERFLAFAQTPQKIPRLYTTAEVELQIGTERISEMALHTLRATPSRRRRYRRRAIQSKTTYTPAQLLSQIQRESKLPADFIRKDSAKALTRRKSDVYQSTHRQSSCTHLQTLMNDCNKLAKLTERTRKKVQSGLGTEIQSIHARYDESPVRLEPELMQECIQEFKVKTLNSQNSLRKKVLRFSRANPEA